MVVVVMPVVAVVPMVVKLVVTVASGTEVEHNNIYGQHLCKGLGKSIRRA